MLKHQRLWVDAGEDDLAEAPGKEGVGLGANMPKARTSQSLWLPVY